MARQPKLRTTAGHALSHHDAAWTGGSGEGLIAREIREQRERELQLLLQRQQVPVTSQCHDDVTVTDSETANQLDSDRHIHRVTRQSESFTEREEDFEKVTQSLQRFNNFYKLLR